MRNWDWMDWLLATLAAATVGILAGIIMDFTMRSKASEKFRSDSPGKTYQALVMELGTPTDREAFPDGTEVVCWKKYHKATTTIITSGKATVPVRKAAHTSGWKAVMRDGVCIRMDAL